MLSLKTYPCSFCHAARDCLMLFQTGIHFFVVVLEEISKCTLQSTWGHEDNRVDCYKQNCFFSSDLHLLFQVAVWFWLPKRQNPQNYCLPIIIHQKGGLLMGFFFVPGRNAAWKSNQTIIFLGNLLSKIIQLLSSASSGSVLPTPASFRVWLEPQGNTTLIWLFAFLLSWLPEK